MTMLSIGAKVISRRLISDVTKTHYAPIAKVPFPPSLHFANIWMCAGLPFVSRMVMTANFTM